MPLLSTHELACWCFPSGSLVLASVCAARAGTVQIQGSIRGRTTACLVRRQISVCSNGGNGSRRTSESAPAPNRGFLLSTSTTRSPGSHCGQISDRCRRVHTSRHPDPAGTCSTATQADTCRVERISFRAWIFAVTAAMSSPRQVCISAADNTSGRVHRMLFQKFPQVGCSSYLPTVLHRGRRRTQEDQRHLPYVRLVLQTVPQTVQTSKTRLRERYSQLCRQVPVNDTVVSSDWLERFEAFQNSTAGLLPKCSNTSASGIGALCRSFARKTGCRTGATFRKHGSEFVVQKELAR